MQERPDKELLRDYAEQKSEKAFGEIVSRYSDLVYSAALRQAASPDLARDISQTVFIDLARKARFLSGKLGPNDSLAGWLYRGARYETLNALRIERRRHAREREVMEPANSHPETPPDWERLRPVLDEAMAALRDEDREALLLRFFKNRELRAVGDALGVSDDAAQKRVTRSLDKLRAVLLHRGISTSGAALSAILAANGVEIAPVGLAAALAGGSLAVATGGGAGAALSILNLMSMSKLQLALSAGLAVGFGAYVMIEHQDALRLRQESESARAQVTRLKSENDGLSARLKLVNPPQSPASDQTREVARLRGEVTRLRDQAGALQQKLRQGDAAKAPADSQETESDRLMHYQQKATETAMLLAMDAAHYSSEHNYHHPTNWSQMTYLFPKSNDFGTGITLDDFEIVNAGIARYDTPDNISLRERALRKTPDGNSWTRVYGMCDGQVKTITFANPADFDTWEQQHSIAYPDSPPAGGPSQ